MSDTWANAPEFVPGARYVPRVATSVVATHPPATSVVTQPTSPTTVGLSTPTTPSTTHPTHSTGPHESLAPPCTAKTIHSGRQYSEVVACASDHTPTAPVTVPDAKGAGSSGALCPYYLETGECPDTDTCVNVHGLLCEHCDRYCLPPNNNNQQKYHRDICADLKQRERKYHQAAEASKDMTCCICYEVVLEKEDKKSRKFGLLSECQHVFCLECIRKWRATQSNDHSKRKCPICRKLSYFIIPSDVWISDMAEKDHQIQRYKEHLATKDCMHFNKGREHCPFGANCFYKHALPDGTIVSDNVVQRRINQNGDIGLVTSPFLSDFIEELINFTQDQIQAQAIRALFRNL